MQTAQLHALLQDVLRLSPAQRPGDCGQNKLLSRASLPIASSCNLQATWANRNTASRAGCKIVCATRSTHRLFTSRQFGASPSTDIRQRHGRISIHYVDASMYRGDQYIRRDRSSHRKRNSFNTGLPANSGLSKMQLRISQFDFDTRYAYR